MAAALRTRLTAGEAAFLDQALVFMQWSPSGGGTRELSVAEQQLGFQLEMASLSLAGGGLAIELLSEYLEAWHSSLPDVFGRGGRGCGGAGAPRRTSPWRRLDLARAAAGTPAGSGRNDDVR